MKIRLPEVQIDLEYLMSHIAADADPNYQHDDERPDDRSAHIRMIIAQASLNIPVIDTRCALGMARYYFWEYRTHSHQRNIIMAVR